MQRPYMRRPYVQRPHLQRPRVRRRRACAASSCVAPPRMCSVYPTNPPHRNCDVKHLMEEKVELNKASHALGILERFNQFRKANKHCDFIIRAGDKEMPVHKCVVSASSEYFDAMLSHETQENIQGVVEIKQVDPDCVVKCIDFMYTGGVSVSEEKRRNLMHVAHMLQLQRLHEGIAVFLEKKLGPSSFFSTREIANMYDCTKLVEVCNEFAFKNFRAIVNLDGFKMLETNYVNFLLSSDALEVANGIKCKALMTWVNHDSSRAASLLDLIQHVDLSQVPMTYRRFLIENEPAVSNSIECLKLILKSTFDGNTKATDLSLDQSQEILVLDSISQTLKQFDLRGKARSNLQSMHHDMVKKRCSVVSVEEYIYVLIENRTTFRLRFREANCTWEQMENRSGHWGAAVVANGIIYCTEQGHYGNQLERYDTQRDQWSFTASRSSKFASCAIAILQENVFLIGGLVSNGGLVFNNGVSTVEYFNQTNSSWSNAPSLKKARYDASAATLKDAIYVFGGHNGSAYIQSLEIYCNATWELVNLDSFSGRRFSSYAIEGKIYLVGNKDSNFQTIDEYDPKTGQLQTVTTLSDMTVYRFSSVAIKT